MEGAGKPGSDELTGISRKSRGILSEMGSKFGGS